VKKQWNINYLNCFIEIFILFMILYL
jgi:hypothetical protein